MTNRNVRSTLFCKKITNTQKLMQCTDQCCGSGINDLDPGFGLHIIPEPELKQVCRTHSCIPIFLSSLTQKKGRCRAARPLRQLTVKNRIREWENSFQIIWDSKLYSTFGALLTPGFVSESTTLGQTTCRNCLKSLRKILKIFCLLS